MTWLSIVHLLSFITNESFVIYRQGNLLVTCQDGCIIRLTDGQARMIVCADDFGLRADIDEAILELCEVRKLSAVSCMTLLNRCTPEGMRRLAEFREHVDIGLHLCFTAEPDAGGASGSNRFAFRGFGSLLRATQTGQVRQADVLAEIRAQYDLFLKKAGCPPAHVDGHLHAHQIPMIREALIAFVSELPRPQPMYVRNTAAKTGTLWKNRLPWIKAAVIGVPGNRMRRRLTLSAIQTNHGFAGIYDFRNYRRFARYLPRFSQVLTYPNGILVVHPGKADSWRIAEYTCLKEARFPAMPVRFAFAAG